MSLATKYDWNMTCFNYKIASLQFYFRGLAFVFSFFLLLFSFFSWCMFLPSSNRTTDSIHIVKSRKSTEMHFDSWIDHYSLEILTPFICNVDFPLQSLPLPCTATHTISCVEMLLIATANRLLTNTTTTKYVLHHLISETQTFHY